MNQNLRIYFLRGVVAAITIGMFIGMYRLHLHSTQAEIGLEKAQNALQTAKQEHEKWTTIRKAVGKQLSKTGHAFHSFGRDQMHEARRKVMDGVECDKALFFTKFGNQWSIWVPEDGHQLEVLIDAQNLQQSDVLEGALASKTNLKFELNPGQLHTFLATRRTTHQRHGAKTFLSWRFDQEEPIEITLKGEEMRSVYGGAKEADMVRPAGIARWYPFDDPNAPELIRRGCWYSYQSAFYEIGNRRTPKNPPLTISLQPMVTTSKPIYATERVVKRLSLSATEVTDTNSKWHRWLEIDRNSIQSKPSRQDSVDQEASQ